jgi:hypothetical protein
MDLRGEMPTLASWEIAPVARSTVGAR